ncbi:Alpha/Beta hydrolase protein [Pilobolus umbonatus]|nr:Alpha/Beta hydrolase protein [Pilobolus umbonatus]
MCLSLFHKIFSTFDRILSINTRNILKASVLSSINMSENKSIRVYHKSETVPISINYSSKPPLPFHEYITQQCPSLFHTPFSPTSYLYSGHLQTLYASFYKEPVIDDDISYEREIVAFAKGGEAALDWVIPTTSLPEETPTVVLFHGITGDSDTNYIRELLQIITRAPINYRAVVYNARGCGTHRITTPQLFNAAVTDDIREMLPYVQKKVGSDTPLIGIGFSLGSNILVKYLGEEQERTPFIAAISIANPFDLLVSGLILDQHLFTRNVYSRGMANNLKEIFWRNKDVMAARKDINQDEVMAAQTVRQYDEACVKKMSNYTTVNNYYRDGSCSRLIEHVRIPLLCINAEDDPIVSHQCIPYDEVRQNPYVVLVTTKQGGHLGWFEYFFKPTRWIHKPIIEYVIAMFRSYDATKDKVPLDADIVSKSAMNIRKRRID